jgi:hypothetical protein
MRHDARVPDEVRAFEREHLPLLLQRRCTDAEHEQQRRQRVVLCGMIDALAKPLLEGHERESWRRGQVAALLAEAARREVDHGLARWSALFTIAAFRTLPGIVWRLATRLAGFTVRPPNGDVVVEPWVVAKAVFAGTQGAGDAFEALGLANDEALRGYFGRTTWTASQLEQEGMSPGWPR